ncbi:hypothetical protein ACFX2I_007408 [Malus domestica]
MCPSLPTPLSLSYYFSLGYGLNRSGMVLVSEGLSEGQDEEEGDAEDWRMIRHYYRIADLPESFLGSREPARRTHVTSLAERLEREARLLKVRRSWRTIRRKTKEAVKTTSWVTLDPNVGQLGEQRALG